MLHVNQKKPDWKKKPMLSRVKSIPGRFYARPQLKEAVPNTRKVFR
jgi:hypothetical protein